MKLEIQIETVYKFKSSYYFPVITSTFGSKIPIEYLPTDVIGIYTK